MSHETGRPRIVGTKDGSGPWAEAAHDVLVETARTYGATLSYTDLADEVQRRTGLTTRAAMRNWIGGVLGLVVQRCHDEGEPPLTSLVVHKTDGMVGVGYEEVLRVLGEGIQEGVAAREEHAARARLACYRRYCDDVPEDAAPMMTAIYQQSLDRARSRTAAPELPPVCSSCFLQLPLTGVCPECG